MIRVSSIKAIKPKWEINERQFPMNRMQIEFIFEELRSYFTRVETN
jgi:hypothetical protein